MMTQILATLRLVRAPASLVTFYLFAVNAGSQPPAAPVPAAVAEQINAAAIVETPRNAAGHPDMTGYWSSPRAFNPFGGTGELQRGENGEFIVMPAEATVTNVNAQDVRNVAARRENKRLRPRYKPEYQVRADELFDGGDLNDPTYACGLPGVPRVGPPREIVQTTDAVYLLYEDLVNRFRVIPTDGREHDMNADPLANGNAIGYWDDDTFVIDVRNIAEDTWIDRDGSFHSPDMRVVERLTRIGNTLRYELTVEDPYFAEPFKPEPQTFVLAEQGTHILDEWPCIERSIDHMVDSTKH